MSIFPKLHAAFFFLFGSNIFNIELYLYVMDTQKIAQVNLFKCCSWS